EGSDRRRRRVRSRPVSSTNRQFCAAGPVHRHRPDVAVTRYNDGLMSVDGPPASGPVPELQSPSLVGQIIDGRYRLVRKLGEGGMGEVYAAEHVHIEKRFAVKLLRPEIVSNPEAVTRFRQEARSSSSIGH